MEWPVLLASTARLLDLHDSDRTVGGSIYSPDERRRGAGMGLWLDVGTRLLPIRGAGDEHEFNENLSEGQKAALSLMWAIRLAEFAIEREAKRLSSRRSQQKAREMSVNIMLIDGLFSNLSNR